MLDIGRWNNLTILKQVDFGSYLDDGDGGEILLPASQEPEGCAPGDEVEVFVCYDSEDRLVALRESPRAQVGEFAVLKVVAVEKTGAFLDWGLPKDLLLPYAEQSRELTVGQSIIVYVYLDKSRRICASMRLERNASKEPATYEPGQEVDLLVIGKTDLGYKALIDGRHVGVIFANEVFRDLDYAQRTKGFIKQIRPDGKIDLTLNKAGEDVVGDVAAKIMKMLKLGNGFLAVTDKTPPEEIYALFGASKKKFKIALGGLYKKRLILIEDDGIRAV